MKKFSRYCVPVCLGLISSSAALAANKAVPIGIDLGTTTCTQVRQDKASEWNLSEPVVSAWSDGTLLKSSNPSIAGLSGVSSLVIVCDPQDRTILVELKIPKRSVQEIANGLDDKYKSVKRNLPSLGNGTAQWKASNATISISYQHVSFDAYLEYETPEAAKLWKDYQQKENEKKRQEMTNQL